MKFRGSKRIQHVSGSIDVVQEEKVGGSAGRREEEGGSAALAERREGEYVKELKVEG